VNESGIIRTHMVTHNISEMVVVHGTRFTIPPPQQPVTYNMVGRNVVEMITAYKEK
jgi:hypothetical protein